MKSVLEKIGACLLIIIGATVVFYLFFGIPIYMYKDCKKVGHSTIYCILNL